MECPECGLALGEHQTVCPRCLTRLTPKKEDRAAEDALAASEPLSADALEDDLSGISGQTDKSALGAFLQGRAISKVLLFLTLALALVGLAVFVVVFAAVTRRDAAYYVQQAQGYWESGQFELALSAYLRALDRDPNLAGAESGAGWCYLELARPSLAIAHLQRAVSIDLDLLDAHRGLGIAYSDVHKWPEAEASLKRALAIREHDAETQSHLGYVYYREQRYDEAIALLQEATRGRPDEARAHEYLGRSLYAVERYDEALVPLRAAAELDPESDSAREYLGLVGFELGRCDWALEQFRLLQTEHPDDPAWYAYVGQCLQKEGDYEGAISHLNHALVLSRADQVLSKSHLYLGWSYYEQERYHEAVIAFQRALIMDPYDPRAMSGLGWSYVQLEQCEDARPLFEDAVRIDSYLLPARKGLEACPQDE